MDEPVSRNLSRKNTKPLTGPAAEIVASQN